MSRLEAGPKGLDSVNTAPTGDFQGATNARAFIESALKEKYGTSSLTERTIDELIEVGNTWAKGKGSGAKASSAMGLGQITATTMNMLKNKGVVSGDDLYDEATQLKMIEWIIRNKRPAIRSYIEGKSDDLEKALKEFGLEWEAFTKPENFEEGRRILMNLRGEQ